MKVEVGKEYMCKDQVVRIMSITTDGTWQCSSIVFGMVADSDGDYCGDAVLGTFDINAPTNPAS